METTRFIQELIVFALRQSENGTWVAEVCCKMRMPGAIFYNWKKKVRELAVHS